MMLTFLSLAIAACGSVDASKFRSLNFGNQGSRHEAGWASSGNTKNAGSKDLLYWAGMVVQLMVGWSRQPKKPSFDGGVQ